MSSDVLPSKSRQSYLRIVRVSRLCLQQKEVLAFATKAKSTVEGEVPFAVHFLFRASLMQVLSSSLTFPLNTVRFLLVAEKKPSKVVAERFFNVGIRVVGPLRAVIEKMSDENLLVLSV